MDFQLNEEEAALRLEIDAWLDINLPKTTTDPDDQAGLLERDRAFLKRLAGRGWIAPAWPKQYGGLAATPLEQAIFSERMAYRNAPNPTGLLSTPIGTVGPTIIVHGTEEQKRQHLPGITGAVTGWCQGFSEPAAGSDLASLQTRAVRDGDDYVVNGQKIWTTSAHYASWMILLARTDAEAPKHRGISCFLVEMQTPGITVRPLPNLAGHHGFNEVFFDNVRVPRANLVGEENRGWYVATTTLDFERSHIGGTARARRLLDEAINQVRGTDHRSAARRALLAELVIECEVGQWLGYRVAWLQTRGIIPNVEASAAKLFSTELGQRVSNALVNVWGLTGQLQSAPSLARLSASPGPSYLQSTAMTIAGGTSEIQRNVIATRGLGLPR
jgi:alkylation response protein AidB-like acyl-CoA dehydrogenase